MELRHVADANIVMQPTWERGGGFVHIVDADAMVQGSD